MELDKKITQLCKIQASSFLNKKEEEAMRLVAYLGVFHKTCGQILGHLDPSPFVDSFTINI